MKTMIIIIGAVLIATVCWADDIMPRPYIPRDTPVYTNETLLDQWERQRQQREIVEILRDIRYNQELESLGMSLNPRYDGR